MDSNGISAHSNRHAFVLRMVCVDWFVNTSSMLLVSGLFLVLSCSHEVLVSTGYLCPNCDSKYCELPTDCKVCGCTLVSAPHLAKSYHHLFPVPTFPELQLESRCLYFSRIVSACLSSFSN
jgi:hypothetical protein